MKLPALFSLFGASRSVQLASLAVAGGLGLGCESTDASDNPRPVATAKPHPAFPTPNTQEMRSDPEPSQVRADPPPPPKPRDKKDWDASCMIQRACSPEPKEIPFCDANAPQKPWSEAAAEGDALLGKAIAVSGTLGLSLTNKTGAGKCAPGVCCHKLDMQIVLVSEPGGSLPLRGLTCSGDDSTLCCRVPAEGQAVIATGKLEKAGGASKWQLAGAKLCLIDTTPRH